MQIMAKKRTPRLLAYRIDRWSEGCLILGVKQEFGLNIRTGRVRFRLMPLSLNDDGNIYNATLPPIPLTFSAL
jgi:hypothetical protein